MRDWIAGGIVLFAVLAAILALRQRRFVGALGAAALGAVLGGVFSSAASTWLDGIFPSPASRRVVTAPESAFRDMGEQAGGARLPSTGIPDRSAGQSAPSIIPEPDSTPMAAPSGSDAGVVVESFPTEALEALATAGPVTVEVQRCERLRTTVICHLSLENTGPDRQFLIDDKWHIDPTPLEGDTRIIDDKGNAYLVANIRIANFPPDRKSGGVKATLVSNVPTPATLAFNGVPEGVAKIVRLDVRSWLTRSDDRVLTFRNIPIV